MLMNNFSLYIFLRFINSIFFLLANKIKKKNTLGAGVTVSVFSVLRGTGHPSPRFLNISLAARGSYTAPFIPSPSSDTGLIILTKSAE